MSEQPVFTDQNNTIGKRSKIDWEQIVSHWKVSGLSKAAFCRQENIDLKLFYHWSLKMAKTKKSLSPKLIPVNIDIDSLNSKQQFQASFPNGVKVKFPLPNDVDTLAKLIKELFNATAH